MENRLKTVIYKRIFFYVTLCAPDMWEWKYDLSEHSSITSISQLTSGATFMPISFKKKTKKTKQCHSKFTRLKHNFDNY